MRRITGVLALALLGCTDPALTAHLRMDENGMHVQPVFTGRIGELTVGVAP